MLRSVGAEVLNPVYQHWRSNGFDGGHMVDLSLFPRYIFMRGDIAAVWPHIVRERAIMNVLKTADSYDLIPDSLIQQIIARIGPDNYVRMLEPGDKVRITDGVYKNLTGIFERATNKEDRISILIDAAIPFHAEVRSSVVTLRCA